MVIAALLSFPGCAGTPEAPTSMRVEFDVFSGQPNPAWELSAQEAAELARRLADLPRHDQTAAEGGLGYRGFVISNPQKIPGLPVELRVYRGVLTVPGQGGALSYGDVNRIEQWLLEQAGQRGYGDLVDQAVRTAPR